MGLLVVTGAQLMCPFGTAPGNFSATTKPTVKAQGKPAGTIKDTAAMMNIAPFGMCTSLANPQVAAATAAALGVLTPQPCMLLHFLPYFILLVTPLKNILITLFALFYCFCCLRAIY